MEQILNYIIWQPDLEAFRIGPMAVRWYGLMWIIGLALAYIVVKRLYNEQKIKDELFDPLFIYCFFGILIGARLGHCIFYQPQDFLTSFKGIVEMLLPIHFLPDGGWKLTGYAGLASHGGTLGLMIALWLYVRKTKLSIWTVLDNIAIATGTTADHRRALGLYFRTCRHDASPPWPALRSHCLCHPLRHHVVSS